MSTINLTAEFFHPIAISNFVQYARIDNTTNPVFITVYPNPITSPAVIASNIPDGQYQINSTPIYADGRTCQPTITITQPCSPLISLNATVNGGVLVVSYLAPAGTPQIQINVAYPNGGSYSQMYVNSGNPISIALPANLFGNFAVTGQSVCDPVSMFLSTFSPTVTVTVNQPVSNYYSLSNNATTICSAIPQLYYTSGVFTTDTTLFTDATLTTAVTGYSFVMINNIVYAIDPTTGIIGNATGGNCNTSITGVTSYSTGLPNGTGTITAPAGTTVHVSLTANGPSGGTYTLQMGIGSLSILQSVSNGTNTFTFVMPGTGSVAFYGNYSSTNSTGGGSITVS